VQTTARPPEAGPPLGETLATLRRTAGLTQVQLAEKLGASQRAISHVEHEPNPRVATLDGYVQALGGRLELRAVLEDRSVALLLTTDA
jgi:transcriptional regulator with XRE-family HTH domain